MLENNEGVRGGNLSQSALGVGGSQEEVSGLAALGFSPVWCQGPLPDWPKAACTPQEEGTRGWAGSSEEMVLSENFELHALCSYSILTTRPETDAIITLTVLKTEAQGR